MKKTNELDVRGTLVRVIKIGGEDYVCLTDMAKLKSEDAQQTISNWMRNRMTLEYLGLWEELYNPDFNPLGFEGFRKEVGLNHFTMSPSKWICDDSRLHTFLFSCRESESSTWLHEWTRVKNTIRFVE